MKLESLVEKIIQTYDLAVYHVHFQGIKTWSECAVLEIRNDSTDNIYIKWCLQVIWNCNYAMSVPENS